MILRASGWLGCIMIALGFAQSVWQLAGLRLLQGAMSGFQAAVVPLLAAETPKGKSGWAMSMFFAAEEHCAAFRYDPLRREIRRTPKIAAGDYRPEDFEL